MQVSASDPEDGTNKDGINGIGTFSLTQTFNKFRIDPDSGTITNVVTLDREVRDSYEMQVVVKDGAGNAESCSVSISVLDVNDNYPKFTQLSYNLDMTDSQAMNPLAIITATDQDSGSNGAIKYSLVNNFASKFSIDSTTGRLSGVSLDFEDASTPRSYILEVVATDGGSPKKSSSIKVPVSLHPRNEFSPVFAGTPYTVSVPEDTPIGTILSAVVSASDRDSSDTGDGRVVFYLEPKNDFFEISSDGEVMVTSQLDYESMVFPHEITLNVVASDLGSSPGRKTQSANYVIKVTNSNDIEPSCKEYHKVVYVSDDPNLTSGLLASLICSDIEDGSSLQYSIESVNDDATYSGTPSFTMTGNKLQFSGGSFDYDVTKFYKIIIKVSDQVLNPLSVFVEISLFVQETISIEPIFSPSSYSFYVDENSSAGTFVGDVDTVHENVNTLYYLIGSKLFSIDPITGHITTTKSLDREVSGSHVFTVRATWKEQTSFTAGITGKTDLAITVTVNDLNDNSPVFPQSVLHMSVPETQTKTLSLSPTDADTSSVNNIVTMSLDPSYNGGAQSPSFSFSGSTLTINFDKGLDFDNSPRSFEIRVLAKDSGTPSLTSTATVFVEVLPENEADPVSGLASLVFNINEGVPPGTIVTTMIASDADSSDTGDGTLRFTLQTPNSQFSVGFASGIIRTKTVLDHEATSSYSLPIVVSDLGSPVRSLLQTLTVNVNDLNDEQVTCGSPVSELFHFTQTETMATSGTIGTITCNGNDATTSFNTLAISSVQISPVVSWLSVSLSGSTISVTHSSPIDFESLAVTLFKITMNVYDNAGTAPSSFVLLTVKVDILNANEFTPSFTNLPSSIIIDESLAVGSLIFDVDATDDDAGTFGVLTYTITSGNSEGRFAIDSNSAQILIKQKLDFETSASYVLQVEATDGGDLTVLGSLTVNINDVNDNSPYCHPPIYAVSVLESRLNSDGPFVSLVCTDADSVTDPANSLKYIIATSDPRSDSFAFDSSQPNKLEVKPAATLDYETGSYFTLVVHVTDSSKIHTSTVSVLIDILPVNEFDPTFALTEYTCNIYDTLDAGDPVCSVLASDADKDEDGDIDYAITAGNELGKFLIDSKTGEISILNKININNFNPIVDPKLFELQVTAFDRSLTSRKSSAPVDVKIWVTGGHPTPPVCESYFEGQIPENQVTPFTIVDVDTICTDSQVNEPPFNTYDVISGDATHLFTFSGSKLQLSGSLNFETSECHNLTIRVCDFSYPRNLCTTFQAYITVDPINECEPKFSLPASGSYESSISEDTPVGSKILSLSAQDCDKRTDSHGHVYFYLKDPVSDNAEVFNVDKFTGDLILGASLDYDGSKKTYTFDVAVSDSLERSSDAKSSVTSVTINVLDVNDNYPLFSPATYLVNIDRSLVIHSPIATLTASDADSGNNALIDFSIPQAKFQSLFYLDQNILKLGASLEDKSEEHYRVVIQAEDTPNVGSSLSSNAVVDIHVINASASVDFAITDDTVLSFPENQSIGSLLFSIAPSELSTQQTDLVFAIVSVSTTRLNAIQPQYLIDSKTGDVFLGSAFDFEDGSSDEITFSATDGAQTLNLKVKIDVTNINEFAPKCHNSLLFFNINENTSPSVISLLEEAGYVTDSDYVIEGTTNQMKFSLLYSSSVEEIFAFDPVSGATGDVSKTGRLELMKPVLDFESDTIQYNIIFKVSDQDYRPKPLTSTCNLRVFVQDLNDNSPQFEPETLFLNVTEESNWSHRLAVFDRDSVSTITACRTNDADFSVTLGTKILRYLPASSLFTRENLGVDSQST